MEWPIIRRTKIETHISKAIKSTKAKAIVKQEDALNALHVKLTLEHEIDLAEKNAVISELNKENSAMQKDLEEARTVYYQSRKDGKDLEALAVSMEKDAQRALNHMTDGSKIYKKIAQQLRNHNRERDGSENQDQKKLGFKGKGRK